jgi:hypothetical protein
MMMPPMIKDTRIDSTGTIRLLKRRASKSLREESVAVVMSLYLTYMGLHTLIDVDTDEQEHNRKRRQGQKPIAIRAARHSTPFGKKQESGRCAN